MNKIFSRMKFFICSILSVSLVFCSINLNVYADSNVPSGYWAENQIQYFIDKGYLVGYEDGSVQPDDYITRAEATELINNVCGFDSTSPIGYSDVSTGDWFYEPISIAQKAGYVTGYNDGTFRPNGNITREEFSVMVNKAADIGQFPDQANKFTDSNTISDWSKGYVGGDVKDNLISGYPDGSFKPQNFITRAEAVTILYNGLDILQKPVATPTPTITNSPTPTPKPSITPVPTTTATATSTSSSSHKHHHNTNSPVPTETPAPSTSPSGIVPTPTPTDSSEPTETPTPTPTETPVPEFATVKIIVTDNQTGENVPNSVVGVYTIDNGVETSYSPNSDGFYELKAGKYYTYAYCSDEKGGIFDNELKTFNITEDDYYDDVNDNEFNIKLNEIDTIEQSDNEAIDLSMDKSVLSSLDMDFNKSGSENWNSTDELLKWKVDLTEDGSLALNIKYSSNEDFSLKVTAVSLQGDILYTKDLDFKSTNGKTEIVTVLPDTSSISDTCFYVDIQRNDNANFALDDIYCEGIIPLNSEVTLNSDNIYAVTEPLGLDHVYYPVSDGHTNADKTIWKVKTDKTINYPLMVTASINATDNGSYVLNLLDEEQNILSTVTIDYSSGQTTVSSTMDCDNLEPGTFYLQLQRSEGSDCSVESIKVDAAPKHLSDVKVFDKVPAEVDYVNPNMGNVLSAYDASLYLENGVATDGQGKTSYDWTVTNQNGDNAFTIYGDSNKSSVVLKASDVAQNGDKATVTVTVHYDYDGDGNYDDEVTKSFQLEFSALLYTVNFSVVDKNQKQVANDVTKVAKVEQDADSNLVYTDVSKINGKWQLPLGTYEIYYDVTDTETSGYTDSFLTLTIFGQGGKTKAIVGGMEPDQALDLDVNNDFNIIVQLFQDVQVQNPVTGKINITPSKYTMLNKVSGGGTISYSSSSGCINGWVDQEESATWEVAFNNPGTYLITANVGERTAGGFIDLYIDGYPATDIPTFTAAVPKTVGGWNYGNDVVLGAFTITNNPLDPMGVGVHKFTVGRHAPASDIKNDYDYPINLYGLTIVPNVNEDNDKFVLNSDNAAFDAPYGMTFDTWKPYHTYGENAEWIVSVDQSGYYNVDLSFTKTGNGNVTFLVDASDPDGSNNNELSYNFDSVQMGKPVEQSLGHVYLNAGTYKIKLGRNWNTGSDTATVSIDNLTLQKE